MPDRARTDCTGPRSGPEYPSVPGRVVRLEYYGRTQAMATEKTDVVIVGVGAAGAILAAELSRAGLKVVGLERGPRLKTADFEPHDELRYFQRQDLRPDVKRQPVTWRTSPGGRARALPTLSYGNQA